MKVLRQIEIDDKQRHREGENAIGQGVEPAFGNKLLGFSHYASLVFPANLKRYVPGEEIQSKATRFLKLVRCPRFDSFAPAHVDLSVCHLCRSRPAAPFSLLPSSLYLLCR